MTSFTTATRNPQDPIPRKNSLDRRYGAHAPSNSPSKAIVLAHMIWMLVSYIANCNFSELIEVHSDR